MNLLFVKKKFTKWRVNILKIICRPKSTLFFSKNHNEQAIMATHLFFNHIYKPT